MFNISISHVLHALNDTEIQTKYGFKVHENVENVSGRGFTYDLGIVGYSEESAIQLTKIVPTYSTGKDLL